MKTLSSFTMALAIFACLFQGCKTVKTVPVVQLDGKWILQSFDGKVASESFKGVIPTLEFDIISKRISGSGGCNSYSGAFDLNGNKFSAPGLASTEKMCFQENQENAFLRLLGNESIISLDSKYEQLVFTQNGKQVLVFEKVKPLSTADLSGLWTLTEIEGAAANTLFAGTLPTVEFNALQLTGNAGCNTYRAPFTLTGTTLLVKNAIATRRACESMAGETKFLHLLSGTATIEVEDNTLILKKEGIVQLKFAR